MEQNKFTDMEIDAIGEIMNISLGSSATAVSNMLNHRVDITTPTVSVVPVEELNLGDLEPAIGVEIKYISGLEGSNIMMLKRSDVKKIVEILLGNSIPDEEFQLDDLTVSAVCEVMNQMMGAASTALSDFLNRPVNISTPQSFTLDDIQKFKKERFHSENGPLVVVRFHLGIESILQSEFVNVMSVKLARELLSGFGFESEKEEAPASANTAPAAPEPQNNASASSGSNQLDQSMIDSLLNKPAATPAQTVPEQPPQQPPVQQQPIQQPVQQTQPIQPTMPAAPQQQYAPAPKLIQTNPAYLPSFDPVEQLGEEQAQNLELIMSVPLEITVEIGHTRRKVEEILTFSKGTLVVLDKLAGDKVDLLVNGLCIAKGDVVVVDDNFGVRITEVLHSAELLGVQQKKQK